MQVSNRLVDQARRGDLEAFEGLYRLHAGRIYAVCRRICGHTAVAEDLTQETFITVWRQLKQLRSSEAFVSWAKRIAIHLTLAHLRKEANWDDEEWITQAAPGEGQNQASDFLDLEMLIGQLPPRARAVFVLHDIEGRSHTEIAEMIGAQTGTCKAQLHRARKLMRAWIEHE